MFLAPPIDLHGRLTVPAPVGHHPPEPSGAGASGRAARRGDSPANHRGLRTETPLVAAPGTDAPPRSSIGPATVWLDGGIPDAGGRSRPDPGLDQLRRSGGRAADPPKSPSIRGGLRPAACVAGCKPWSRACSGPVHSPPTLQRPRPTRAWRCRPRDCGRWSAAAYPAVRWKSSGTGGSATAIPHGESNARASTSAAGFAVSASRRENSTSCRPSPASRRTTSAGAGIPPWRSRGSSSTRRRSACGIPRRTPRDISARSSTGSTPCPGTTRASFPSSTIVHARFSRARAAMAG